MTQSEDQAFLNRLVTAPYMEIAWQRFADRAEDQYGDHRKTERLAMAFFGAARRARHRLRAVQPLTGLEQDRRAEALIKSLNETMKALRRYPQIDLSLVDVLDPNLQDLLKSACWDLEGLGRRTLSEEQLRTIFPFYRMLEIAQATATRAPRRSQARQRATSIQEQIALGVALCGWLEEKLGEPMPSVADAVVAAAFTLEKPKHRSSISRSYHATL